MMAGAFLGWQMIAVSFFVGTFAALFIAVPIFVFKGERMSPFGPGLAAGIMITIVAWSRISGKLQSFFFEWLTVFAGATILGGGMFLASFLVLRRRS